MREDDELFLRCLTVVLLLAGALLSILLLVPVPQSAWNNDLGSSAAAPSTQLVSYYDVRPFFRPSRGPNASPAPVQTGESAAEWGRKLAVAAALAESDAQRVRPNDPAPIAVGGPIAELSLDTSAARPSPAADFAVRSSRGEEALPRHGSSPEHTPRPMDILPPPHRVEVDVPMEIFAMRPGARTSTSGLDSQESGDDPLPEFRRFLPRAQQCAREAGRRMPAPLTGKAILRFTVEKSGWVREAGVTGGSMRDPDAASCLVAALRAERFFPPQVAPITAMRAVIFAH